jgi:hypothetical protein
MHMFDVNSVPGPRRLAQPKRSDVAPDDLEAYDAVLARHRNMLNVPPAPGEDLSVGQHYAALLNSPQWAAAWHRLGYLARFSGTQPDSYSHADREWVDQVVGADFKANHVFPLHIDDAISVGVRLEAIEAIRYGHEEDLNEDERLLTKYIRQVIAGTVDDETFGKMHSRLGDRGIADYTSFICLFFSILRMFQAFGVPEPGDEEIDQHIRDLKSGAVAPVEAFETRFR